jgi:LysR family transcriptional regulator, low CO2-responsive transcriptional regulator
MDRISEFPRHRASPFSATVENFNLLTNSYLQYDLLIMSIVFSQLRAFHAVAAHGGFTAASRVLNIGQPTLTIQVRDLEQAYGVELLIRKSRRVELTPTGAALFEITRGVMKFCDEAHELLAAQGLSPKGHLRVATVGPFHATEILAAFKREHPEVQISTLLGNSERTLRHIIDFEAEVAILADVRDDARVIMIPYRTHRVVVFVNGDHPWFKRKSVTLRELADQPFVLRERGSTTRRAFEAAMEEHGLKVDPVFEIESREGVWKAVERGLGISVVADFEFVPHTNLRTLEIRDRVIETQYSIAYHRDRAHSPIIKAFIDTVGRMKERLPDAPARQRRISRR